MDPTDRQIEDALRRLDHPPPVVSASVIIRRARARERLTPRVIAVSVGAAALATAALGMPGSPVSHWIRTALTRNGASAVATPSSAPASTPAAVTRDRSSIAVVPGPDFELVFDTAQAAGDIRVRFVRDAELSVRAEGGEARYAVLPAGLAVRNAGSVASYAIRVPNTQRGLRIRVGARVVFSRTAGRLRPSLMPNAQGMYVIPLSSPLP